MKRSILLFALSLSCVSLWAIEFNEAPVIEKRVMPQSAHSLLSYHDAIKDATHSIVHIATRQEAKVDRMLGQMHPFFEQFFGPQYRQNQLKNQPRRQGLGSGVIVSKDGYIVTNNHVIDDADEIIVHIPGSDREYEAEVIGSDPKSDIAVIKVDADNLPPIAMGQSSNLEVGDVVFAIGNPFGVGQTVTQGIISAQNKSGVGINEYENFIQTDAPINPGNSGGALVDSRGALIGINTAIITRSGGNNGIGFAIEVDMVKTIARKLIDYGTVERGYMGVNIGDLTKELRNLYRATHGAMVLQVNPDTPAEKAGLKRGDLITAIDGVEVKNAAELKNRIGMLPPDAKVKLTLERDRSVKTLTLKLGSLEDAPEGGGTEMLEGLELMPLGDNARYHYRIPHTIEGVVISNVKPGSEAEHQGLREGDVIVQIEDDPIRSMDDLRTALKQNQGVYKRIYISRAGRVFVVALK